ncbi:MULTISPECIES: DUF5343 domain-containing protein [Hyphomicrobiales]|jgi:hypothetical protein|uniref:DUF5343 domain-containing protein n=1 Tax=Bosea massiliensis TaxID=151419 RepID=A0ABW0P5J1_9HYPH|nr:MULTISPECIES: DUF5343 domain-containing protein [Hyphomicrobiales]
MAANLPYLATPGSIKNAFEKIKTAATPDRVTADFVKNKLLIKGGAGAALPPFLKRIGFANSDATPSEIYHRFRNAQTSGAAVAEALRYGYKELFEINEACYDLNESDLHSLVCQVTGAAADSNVARLTVTVFRYMKAYADFSIRSKPQAIDITASDEMPKRQFAPPSSADGVGLNLSYTINLNLPATADQAVFNAIFRSLREHLLNGQ